MDSKLGREDKISFGGGAKFSGSKCSSEEEVSDIRNLRISESTAEAKSSSRYTSSETKSRELDRELEKEADAEFEALKKAPAPAEQSYAISPRARELTKGLRM
jgi:hypothetical protein